jgi:hypothetical protein
MTRAKQSFHSPSSPHYSEEQNFDERSFWSRDEVLEMDMNFKAAMFGSDEWKARLQACTKS